MQSFRNLSEVSLSLLYQRAFSILLLCQFFCAPAAAQLSGNETTLAPGKPAAKEIEGGATHSFKVAARAGDFLRLSIEQKSVDVSATLRGPGGEKLIEVDRYFKAPEQVFLLAAVAGVYTLEVRAKARSELKGIYEARVEESRPATREDEARVRAESLFDEATALFRLGTEDSARQAAAKYEEARAAFGSLGDRDGEALSMVHVGAALFAAGDDVTKAVEFQRRALDFSRERGHRFAEAMALRELGQVLSVQGDVEAVTVLKQSVELARALGELSLAARTLAYIGDYYQRREELHSAATHYEQALNFWQQFGDTMEQAAAMTWLASVYNQIGEKQKAIELYDQALPLARSTNDRITEALIYNNRYSVYSDLGDRQKALDSIERALNIWRELGMRGQEAVALANIGTFYKDSGEHRKALEYFEKALPVIRDAKERSNEGIILYHIGSTFLAMGEYDKALEQLGRSLEIRRAISHRPGESLTLAAIGMTWLARGDSDRAHACLEQALTVARAARNQRMEMRILADFARVERARGNLSQARTHIGNALELVESTRTKLTSPQLRTSYSAAAQDYYGLQIQVLMDLHRRDPAGGFDALALQANERARARGLLELIAEARVDLRQGVSPQLLTRERELQQQLISKSEEQSRSTAVSEGQKERDERIDREIKALLDEYEQVQMRIRQSSPRYAGLTQPAPLDVQDLQHLLDADTALLEYALGAERSFLWVVTRAEVKSFELPPRAEIEEAARGVYEALTARNSQPQTETAETRSRRIAEADAGLDWKIEKLSRMVIEPGAARLARAKRLVVVADGALQYVTFAALNDAAPEPLAAKFEIAYLPSASTLALLRSEASNRPRATRAVAVVADPVFNNEDVRVRRARRDSANLNLPAKAASPRAAVRSGEELLHERALHSLGGIRRGAAPGQLPRLPFSRREAEMIFSVAPAATSAKILDFNASRETVLSREFSQYSIIHFATHGLLDSERPELSSIVLSLVDREGRPVIGFLRLNEIYNLRLGADLAVLSACQTALGRDMRGEGIIGLTRGFMFAGARRVVASLWQVDDEATSELMRRFYEGMLKQKLTPAAALHRAQSEMARGAAGARFKSPYYWAGFVLQGEYK